jgi:hypothetical protein
MKEVYMKKASISVIVLFALFSSVVIVNAGTTPKTVNVTASVSQVSALTAVPTLTTTDVTATSLEFGAVSSAANPWATLAPQYVKMSVSNNSVSWRLRLTTKNFATAPPTATWGYAYGGLKGAIDGAKVPLGWRVSTGTVVAAAPAVGDPSLPAKGWTFIKDQSDVDDPATTGVGQDESFTKADTDGYCNIAFGNASSTIAIAGPPTGSGPVVQTQLPTNTTSFKVFVEGNFNGAGATTYTTILNFDLIYQ